MALSVATIILHLFASSYASTWTVSITPGLQTPSQIAANSGIIMPSHPSSGGNGGGWITAPPLPGPAWNAPTSPPETTTGWPAPEETTTPGWSVETTTPGWSVETTTPGWSVETTTPGWSVETTTPGWSVETTTPGWSVETTTAAPETTTTGWPGRVTGWTVPTTVPETTTGWPASEGTTGWSVETTTAAAPETTTVGWSNPPTSSGWTTTAPQTPGWSSPQPPKPSPGWGIPSHPSGWSPHSAEVEIEMEGEAAVVAVGSAGATHSSSTTVIGDSSNPAILDINTGSFAIIGQEAAVSQLSSINPTTGDSSTVQVVEGANYADSGDYYQGQISGNQISMQNEGSSFAGGQGIIALAGSTENESSS